MRQALQADPFAGDVQGVKEVTSKSRPVLLARFVCLTFKSGSPVSTEQQEGSSPFVLYPLHIK